MGAALAAHAVPSLLVNGHRVSHAFMYGLYRIGNKNFAQWVDEIYRVQSESRKGKMIRVVHHKDLVPHLPPSNAGYVHFSKEIFYNGNLTDGYTICDDDDGEDPKCSAQFKNVDYDVMNHMDYFDYHVMNKDSLPSCAVPKP